MKLIIQNNRIAATATDEYQPTGSEQAVISAPADLDVTKIDRYEYIGGALIIPIPQSVTMRQARLAMLSDGILDDVEGAIAAIPDETQRKAAQIEWEYAQDVARDHWLLASLMPVIGLTDAQVDELFVLADTL